MSARRHLIIVASQCAAEETVLVRLGEAADGLEKAFLDPLAGGCVGGFRDGSAVLRDAGFQDTIGALHGAIEHAAQQRATLVLCLLGHGFAPGESNRLHFLAMDSTPEAAAKAVDVGSIVAAAAGDSRINGVIVIVDTCMAAAGAPAVADLLASTAGGQLGLVMLLAAGRGEYAIDLRVSRGLADLLSTGSADFGDKLTMADSLTHLRQLIPDQNLTAVTVDAGGDAEGARWLSRNPLSGQAPDGLGAWGSFGRGYLRDVIAGADEDGELAGAPTLSQLQARLQRRLQTSAVQRVSDTLAKLEAARLTGAFLRSWCPQLLTTSTLRKAFTTVATWPGRLRQMPDGPTLYTETDFVEFLALKDTTKEEPYQVGLTRFVAAVARLGELALDHPDLLRWASSLDAGVHARNAAQTLLRYAADPALRLIIDLHTARTTSQWPVAADVWLLRDGVLIRHERFTHDGKPDQASTEALVNMAVDWADDLPEAMDTGVSEIDIAMPTWLLLNWRPEAMYASGPGLSETGVLYQSRLGSVYRVGTRWSNLLGPGRRGTGSQRLWRHKSRRLDLMDAQDGACTISWLTPAAAADGAGLQQRLADDSSATTFGLHQHPGMNLALMDLLLSYAPVVIWPDPGTEPDAVQMEAIVTARWGQLPDEFLQAIRRRWRLPEQDPIADLRTVWDDRAWLGFCRSLDTRIGLRSAA
ncbi:hypothetical protein QEZ54_08585 [Catellatospora sp. KI3]|uniref:vWA-MoxR associated conflict system protein n=1 Tax=Catellatospora sp. KI3 TaxID=3041620 RepID=UPI0024829FBB|nr:hypothetical protein [Catellatospora sp. KI3]MDI1461018.1 hypothetical protein [Catellatospora sp. KI3]